MVFFVAHSNVIVAVYYLSSPLPYHTANGKTVPAVIVILRADSRLVRTQVVTVGSRASSSRPPVARRDACVDAAIRAIVVARTEKVERIALYWRDKV